MFGADPKSSKEPAKRAEASSQAERPPHATCSTDTPGSRNPRGLPCTTSQTAAVRTSTSRGVQCATSLTAENLNLPEPVHYATQNRRPCPRRGSSLHCSLPRSKRSSRRRRTILLQDSSDPRACACSYIHCVRNRCTGRSAAHRASFFFCNVYLESLLIEHFLFSDFGYV